jgi:hypothetical protein
MAARTAGRLERLTLGLATCKPTQASHQAAAGTAARLSNLGPMTKQAALIALQRNRGELDAAALARLLAATKA